MSENRTEIGPMEYAEYFKRTIAYKRLCLKL